MESGDVAVAVKQGSKLAAVSAAVGAGVALLLAPYPAEQMRKRVTTKAKELEEKTNRKASEVPAVVHGGP
jgi:gas vesicle protein